MPGLGVVVHHGRRSGRRYQTPVNVFTAGNGYVFALTYGPDTDWVKNVLAAGGCELRTRGQTIQLGSPRLFHDERRAGIRPVERQVLRILDVADFLSLRPVGPARTRLSAQPDRRLHRRRARRRLARSECGGDVSRRRLAFADGRVDVEGKTCREGQRRVRVAWPAPPGSHVSFGAGGFFPPGPGCGPARAWRPRPAGNRGARIWPRWRWARVASRSPAG